MQPDKLNKRLTDLDQVFSENSTPMRERPLEAFKIIHRSVRDQERRSFLFDPINAWFASKYGEKVTWDGIMGRAPLLVRGDLYLAAIQFTIEDRFCDYRECIEGLPSEIAECLGMEDFRNIASYSSRAQIGYKNLDLLQSDDCFLTDDQRELIKRARFNLRSAPLRLKEDEDTQGSIFASHEAAEKFLKAAWLGLNSNKAPEAFRHDIADLFKAITTLDQRFMSLAEPADALKYILGPRMDIRYKTVPRTIGDAISTFYASLAICSTVATILLYDDDRGSRNSSFKSGTYYENAANIAFWCVDASPSNAQLIAFEKGTLRHFGVKIISVKQINSGLYLEVAEKKRSDELKAILDLQLTRARPLADGEFDEVENVNGKEGSFMVGVSRRIRK